MSDKNIIKYELENVPERTGYYSCSRVDMPKGAKVIDVSYEGGTIYLHAIVNTKAKLKARWFDIYEESMPMENYDKKTCEYIGMVNVVPNLYIFEVHD
jgi:hypothetical protein